MRLTGMQDFLGNAAGGSNGPLRFFSTVREAFRDLRRTAQPLLVAGGLWVALTGCTTAPGGEEDAYQAPVAVPGAAVATLKGSSLKEDGLFGSEHRGFVSMIDLKAVPDAAGRWNEPIGLSPGKHNITADYRYSNFMTRAYLVLEAKAGSNYQLMIKQTREDGRMFNDFWIVDLATGKNVTPVLHRQVTGGKKGTIFYQNK